MCAINEYWDEIIPRENIFVLLISKILKSNSGCLRVYTGLYK